DLTGETEVVTTSDALSFAGIPPASINAIVLERHLAEKTHAYTRERTGSRQNTRVKDLVDMVLVAKHFPLDGSSYERSVTRTFSARGAHPTPVELPPPPTGWAVPFARLATEVDIPVEIGPAYALATSLVNPVLAGSVRGSRWDPVSTT